MEPNNAKRDNNAEGNSVAKTCQEPIKSAETRDPVTRFFQVSVSLFRIFAKKNTIFALIVHRLKAVFAEDLIIIWGN